MAIVPKRYSEGLLSIGIELNKVDEFERQLNLLTTDILTDEFYQIVNYPRYTCSQKIELVKKVTKNYVDEYIVNFLVLLLQNERINSIGMIAKEYSVIADEYRNNQVVEITSAFELDHDQLDKLVEKMKILYKSDNIKLKTVIDPSVLGGVKIKKGDTVIDGTLKEKLENIKNAIVKTT